MKLSRIVGPLALMSVGAAVALCGTAVAKDERPLPQAVKDALLRAFPGATLADTERDAVVLRVYEVELKSGDETLDVAVAEDGTIIEVEQAVAREALPAAVASALTQAAGAGTVGKVERSERRARPAFVALAAPTVLFEAKLRRQDGRTKEVCFSPDGRLADDDDDGDDDDDDGDDDDDDDDGDDD